MRKPAARSREDYVQFLQSKIEASTGAPRAALEAAMIDAANHDLTISPLATLSRVVEACDAIENGEAADLARKLKLHEGILRPTRTPINANTVAAYVRLRFERDQHARIESEWTGPRRETLSRPGHLKNYVQARRDALRAVRPSSVGSRVKRAHELIDFLPTVEDRQDMRQQLAEGYKAQRELALLKKAIEQNFPEISLNQLLRPRDKVPASRIENASAISDEDRSALAQLRTKLTDNDRLRHFGLENDGVRLKTLVTRTQFIEKAEYKALFSLIDDVLA